MSTWYEEGGRGGGGAPRPAPRSPRPAPRDPPRQPRARSNGGARRLERAAARVYAASKAVSTRAIRKVGAASRRGARGGAGQGAGLSAGRGVVQGAPAALVLAPRARAGGSEHVDCGALPVRCRERERRVARTVCRLDVRAAAAEELNHLPRRGVAAQQGALPHAPGGTAAGGSVRASKKHVPSALTQLSRRLLARTPRGARGEPRAVAAGTRGSRQAGARQAPGRARSRQPSGAACGRRPWRRRKPRARGGAARARTRASRACSRRPARAARCRPAAGRAGAACWRGLRGT